MVVTAELDRMRVEALFICLHLLNEAVSNSRCVAEDNHTRVDTALVKDMEGDGCCEYENLQNAYVKHLNL